MLASAKDVIPFWRVICSQFFLKLSIVLRGYATILQFILKKLSTMQKKENRHQFSCDESVNKKSSYVKWKR